MGTAVGTDVLTVDRIAVPIEVGTARGTHVGVDAGNAADKLVGTEASTDVGELIGTDVSTDVGKGMPRCRRRRWHRNLHWCWKPHLVRTLPQISASPLGPTTTPPCVRRETLMASRLR